MSEDEILMMILIIMFIVILAMTLPTGVLCGLAVGIAGTIAYTRGLIPKFRDLISGDCGDSSGSSQSPLVESLSSGGGDTTASGASLEDSVMRALRGIQSPPKGDGDTQIVEQMQAVSKKNIDAIHMQARSTSDNARKYFDEELAEQESRHWFENDNLDTLMEKDDVRY